MRTPSFLLDSVANGVSTLVTSIKINREDRANIKQWLALIEHPPTETDCGFMDGAGKGISGTFPVSESRLKAANK